MYHTYLVQECYEDHELDNPALSFSRTKGNSLLICESKKQNCSWHNQNTSQEEPLPCPCKSNHIGKFVFYLDETDLGQLLSRHLISS